LLRALPLILALLLCGRPAAADVVSDRGGAFSLEPAVLMPAGVLARSFYAAPQANLDFDIGINPAWSLVFGAGYSEHASVLQQDAALVLAPVWGGFKSKAHFRQDVELFWDLAGELVYAKEYWRHSGSGSLETLDGGGVAGAGFDLLLTPWLLLGCEAKAHIVVEGREAFPFAELALRLGLRG
jgi:hypothetical protein